MHSVTFGNGYDILRDKDGTSYGTPQWLDNSVPPVGDNQGINDHNYPYLYSLDKQLTISNATWILQKGFHIPHGTPVYIKGVGPDNIDIKEVPAQVDLIRGIVSINGATSTTSKDFFIPPQNPQTTKYYPDFTIEWHIRCGNGPWRYAATSSHIIYVCLCLPLADKLFRTVVHLACSNEGATDPNSAVEKSWNLFRAPGGGPANVMAWDEETQSWNRPLYYYKPGTTFNDNQYTTAGLLSNGTSQCGGWASIMKDALLVNGAIPIYYYARSQLYSRFWIKDWEGIPSLDFFYFQSLKTDMFPYPISSTTMDPDPYGYYGTPGKTTNFKNTSTVTGQNSNYPNAGPNPPFPVTPNAPSQKIFENHQILYYNKKYYDPSYGLTYTDEMDFQNQTIIGFGNKTNLSQVQEIYLFVKTSKLNIYFSPKYK